MHDNGEYQMIGGLILFICLRHVAFSNCLISLLHEPHQEVINDLVNRDLPIRFNVHERPIVSVIQQFVIRLFGILFDDNLQFTRAKTLKLTTNATVDYLLYPAFNPF